MILVDANLLLYAYDSSSEHHEPARSWFEVVMSQPGPVRFAWVTLLAFLRIGTNPRVMATPFTTAEAISTISEWLDCPNAGVLDPGERHFAILCKLLTEGQVRGPLVMDAHLAALAIEHGAALYTNDRDFARFSGLRLVTPLSP